MAETICVGLLFFGVVQLLTVEYFRSKKRKEGGKVDCNCGNCKCGDK